PEATPGGSAAAQPPRGWWVGTGGRYTSPPPATNSADFSFIPRVMASSAETPWASAYSRTSWLMRIEQNFGPHIEQKCAVLAGSAGRVSSWYVRAVSGSSESSNWSCQRNSKRAFDRASSHSWAVGWPLARSAACAAIL